MLRHWRWLIGAVAVAVVQLVLFLPAAAEPLAYVVNSGSGTISVVDTRTNAVTDTIVPGVGSTPHSIAITPDGTRAYVTSGYSTGVFVIDTASNTVNDTFDIGVIGGDFVFAPDSAHAYVASDEAIVVMESSTNHITASIPVAGAPFAVTPDGTLLYATTRNPNSIIAIATATNQVVATIPFGSVAANSAVLAPDGRHVYVADGSSGTLIIIDTATNTVTTAAVTRSGTLGTLAVAPDGSTVYVSATFGIATYIFVIDERTDQVIAKIPVDSSVLQILFAPDGRLAYAGVYNALAIIDTATQRIVGRVPLQLSGSRGVAITPDGAFVYADGCEEGICVISTDTNAVVAAIPGFSRLNRLAVGRNGFAFLTGTIVGVIDLVAKRLAEAIPIYGTDGVAITPDDRLAYVFGSYSGGLGIVSAIDIASATVTGELSLGSAFGNDAGGVAVAPSGAFTYASNSYTNSVAVISPANEIIATIPVGGAPEDIAFSRDGTAAYVVGAGSNAISIIDTATHSVAGTRPLRFGGLSFPQRMVLSPNGAFAYVLNSDTTVSVVDLSTNVVTGAISVGMHPRDIAITPDGAFAYVLYDAEQFSARVAAVDLTTKTVAATILLYDRTAERLAVTPDGKHVWVTEGPQFECDIPAVAIIDTATNSIGSINRVGGEQIVFTPDGRLAYIAGSAEIEVIDAGTQQVVARIPVGGARDMAVTPDGRLLYVAGFDFQANAAQLKVINTTTNAVVDTLSIGAGAIAISPDGAVVYVTGADNLSAIATATNAIVAVIPLGAAGGAVDLAVSPDGARVYVVGRGSSLSVIDVATNTVTTPIFPDPHPRRVAVTPDGAFIYATAPGGPGRVSIVNASKDERPTAIDVGTDPLGIAITADGARAYVANSGSDTVSVLDTATHAVVATIPVGHQPVAVALGALPETSRTPKVLPTFTPPTERPSRTATPTPTASRRPTETLTPAPTAVGSVVCGNGVMEGDEECDDGNTVGGDGCAANCTRERRYNFAFGTGSTLTLQFSYGELTPFELSGAEVVTAGAARASEGSGEIPVVVSEKDIHFDPIEIPGLGCLCVRAVGLDTFGSGNAGRGVIGCGPNGLSQTDYLFSVDHNIDDQDPNCTTGNREGPDSKHPGVCNGLPTVTSSNGGPRGAAVITTALSITFNVGISCAVGGDDPAKGADGVPCTADDPKQSPTDLFVTTTGSAAAQVLDADDMKGSDIAPGAQCGSGPCAVQAAGAPFQCDALTTDSEAGSSGAVLAATVARVDAHFDSETSSDYVFSLVLAVAPTAAKPTPTPTPIHGICGDVCDGRACGALPCPGGHAVSAARCVGPGASGCECVPVDCVPATPTSTVTPTPAPPPLPAGSCGGAAPQYAGPLCGPENSPCVVLRDEVLPLGGYSPSIAVDSTLSPRIFFVTTSGNFVGRYAARSAAGEWGLEQVDIGVFDSGLILDPADVAYVLATNSAFGSALWLRHPSGWEVDEQVHGAILVGNNHSFARDDAGCLHAGATVPAGAAYALRNGTWGYALVGMPGAIVAEAPVLELAPSGQPHLAFWEAEPEAGWVLRWAAPPLPAETVPPIGATGINGQPIGLAVTAAEGLGNIGVPHLLFNRGFPIADLAYATRGADGVWSVQSVAQDSGPGLSLTDACGEPSYYGRCSYTYETFRAIAAVASGNGDVRLFYGHQSMEAHASAQCYGCNCHWESPGPKIVAGSLEMVAPVGESLPRSVVIDGVAPNDGTAVLDRRGAIHLALRDQMGNVRYMLLGSADTPTPLPTATATETPTAPSRAATSGPHSGGGCSMVPSASGKTDCWWCLLAVLLLWRCCALGTTRKISGDQPADDYSFQSGGGGNG